tara:strand:- start:2795 stop:3259 length:465 start_codon:yes stop_codon:yes gene_type:complete
MNYKVRKIRHIQEYKIIDENKKELKRFNTKKECLNYIEILQNTDIYNQSKDHLENQIINKLNENVEECLNLCDEIIVKNVSFSEEDEFINEIDLDLYNNMIKNYSPKMKKRFQKEIEKNYLNEKDINIIFQYLNKGYSFKYALNKAIERHTEAI